MVGRTQRKKELTRMLRQAYYERARLQEKIAGLEAALRDVDPEYRKLMEQLGCD